jgi:hypothetical protein
MQEGGERQRFSGDTGKTDPYRNVPNFPRRRALVYGEFLRPRDRTPFVALCSIFEMLDDEPFHRAAIAVAAAYEIILGLPIFLSALIVI